MFNLNELEILEEAIKYSIDHKEVNPVTPVWELESLYAKVLSELISKEKDYRNGLEMEHDD